MESSAQTIGYESLPASVTAVWEDIVYLLDVCRVTRGAYIEGL
jgi:hypothetical protein